ncbi:MAG: CpsD/CapB family tyrosine-protein kinase [Deltaproteobacteria bacterium]|nr:CpsD/CapB family tyrosine-protein kinase [Deltaproteobacteria bacterium]
MAEIGIMADSIEQMVLSNPRELASIRGNILSAAEDRVVKTLYITSSNPREGKTTTAVSIAYGLSAQASARVLLVDVNFHAPAIHGLFNIDSSPGFAELVQGNSDYDMVIRKTETASLSIIPCGASSVASLDVFRSEKFAEHLREFAKRFDYVIFDGYSFLSSSDASVVAGHFDGIILVVECDKTRWEVVQLAKEKINKVGGRILGAVLNRRKYYVPRAFYD